MTNMQAATGFEKPNTAVLFLYQNTLNGQISLFVILGATGGTAGSTKMTLSGVPAGAKWQVQDDGAGDFREVWALTPPTGSVSWTWDQGRGDGFVLGPLGVDFQLSLFPEFTSGITDVKFLSGDRLAPQTITLNRTDPIVIGAAQDQPPVVSFSVSTADARVNQPLTFDASSSRDPDGQITKYEWDFNGDGIFDQTTTAATVSYTYAASGTKTVTVRATDNEGATARATQTITVGELAVRVTRTISTSAALPGSTFLVIVRMEPQMDVAGVGLQESLPVGWQIKPLENAGAAFKRSTVQWIFVDTIRANTTKVVSYELTVPPASQLMTSTMPVCFTLSGTFQAMTPFMEIPVEGDNKVEVSSALPLKEAIAHLVPRVSVDSEDTIDLRSVAEDRLAAARAGARDVAERRVGALDGRDDDQSGAHEGTLGVRVHVHAGRPSAAARSRSAHQRGAHDPRAGAVQQRLVELHGPGRRSSRKHLHRQGGDLGGPGPLRRRAE